MFKKHDIKLGLNDTNVTLSTVHISTDYKNMSLELTNNTNKTIIGVSVRVIQKDKENNILGVTDFEYNDFICRQNKKFLPKVNIECNENLATIDFKLINVTYKDDEESSNIITKNKKRPITLCKRYVFLAIFILAALFSIVVFSFNYYYKKTTDFITDGTFKYENVNGGLEVVKYYKNDKEVTIPSSYNGTSVVSIVDELFYNSSIETLKIEANTLEVGNRTFAECHSLQTIDANNLVLSTESFSNCTSLVTFNADIIGTIPSYCFNGCSSLTSFASESASYVEEEAFYDCSNLESVYLPSATLYNNAFDTCDKITNVTYKKAMDSIWYAFPNISSFESVSNYESSINLNYFYDYSNSNYLTIEYLHLLNTSVTLEESLSPLNLSNYREDASDGNCYLDDAIILYNGSSEVLNVNNSKMTYYTNVYKNSYILTLNLNVSCTVEDELIDVLSNLETINIYADDVKINSKLSSSLNVNIYSTGTKLSSILQDNTLATINICSNISNQFFDATTQNNIVISSDVSSISNAFSSTTSIEKLIASNSSIFKGQIQGVYELDITSLTSILPENDIKKIFVSGSILESSVLVNSTNLKILDITPKLSGSSLSTLFGASTNEDVPSSLETVYLRFNSVNTSYFQNLKYIKNIAIINTNKISNASIFNGCESLYNVYFESYNSAIYSNLCNNLNNIAINANHKINIISSNILTSNSTYNYLNYFGSTSLSKTYKIKYDNESYTYDELFLSDLNHLIGVSDDYVVRTYTDKSFTNIIYNFTSNSIVYCQTKQYKTYSITSDNIVVTYYYGTKILNKVITSNNLTIDYYYPDEISGYYFVGWFTDSNLTNAYSFNTTITSDLNLYAKYSSNSSYITDNQEVITVDNYLNNHTASNNTSYSYYQKYLFYAPTNGTINVMTIGDTDTYIDVIINSNTYSDDDSGVDKNASLSINVTSGTYTIYVCTNSNSTTNLIFTYSPTSTLTFQMPTNKTVVYTFDALESEEYSIPIDDFYKDGCTFLGIYTTDGNKVFDENGDSTSYWLTYSQTQTTFVVKYDYNN